MKMMLRFKEKKDDFSDNWIQRLCQKSMVLRRAQHASTVDVRDPL